MCAQEKGFIDRHREIRQCKCSLKTQLFLVIKLPERFALKGCKGSRETQELVEDSTEISGFGAG